MAAIAEALLAHGFVVTGSDLKMSSVTRRLQQKGAFVVEGHSAENLGEVDTVIISAAVNHDNPEYGAARSRGIPVIKRAEMLGQMLRYSFGIGVAGTHGKTTTSAMITSVLEAGDLDPTGMIGGTVKQYQAHVRFGKSPYFVTEADEYDRSFLQLQPCLAVLTSLEEEHMECYRDQADLMDAFVEYMNRVPFFGQQIIYRDSELIQKIMPRLSGPIVTYGTDDRADYSPDDINPSAYGMSFDVIFKRQGLGRIELTVPGRHNIQNALAAIAVGLELELSFAQIQNGLRRFKGISRRLEMIGQRDGILVFDDYAHHPTEVTAGIAALKETFPDRRLVVVFQPHLYSRTQRLLENFIPALAKADSVIIADIFPAREKPMPGVHANQFVEQAGRQGFRHFEYLPGREAIINRLVADLKSGDILVTMGAGDINDVGQNFLKN